MLGIVVSFPFALFAFVINPVRNIDGLDFCIESG